MVVSVPYSIPQPMKSLPFYILQVSLKNKPLSSGISLKGHYSECSGILPYDHLLIRPHCYYDYVFFNQNLYFIESFYYFQDPINATTLLLRPVFYGPTVVALMELHCIPIPPNSYSFFLGLFSLF